MGRSLAAGRVCGGTFVARSVDGPRREGERKKEAHHCVAAWFERVLDPAILPVGAQRVLKG